MKSTKKQSLLFLIVLILFTQSIINAQTWEEIGFNLPDGDSVSNITEITFINKNIGWLFTLLRNDPNDAKLYRTTDGGQNWRTIITEDYPGTNNTVLFSMEPDFFYMIKPNSEALFTTDGGITWDSVSIGGEDFSSLYFFSEDKGIAMSNIYTWTTIDGGQTWAQKGKIVLPKDIFFHNENLGWAVGEGPTANDVGYIAKTTDGGENWEYIEEIPAFFIAEFGIEFIDTLRGFVIGEALTKTTDGGNNWTRDYSIFGYDIGFLDNKYGWISSAGQIFMTSDGGETWETQLDTVKNFLFKKIIILKKDKVAYVLGDNPSNHNATLLRADLSNITGIEENNETIPDEFYLYQNYPNPFNPTTSIEYQISRHEMVTLKIYDILGNEIATLVNETKPPGTYKVNFNGSRLASGIYIVRLKAGKFSKAIKICLLK